MKEVEEVINQFISEIDLISYKFPSRIPLEIIEKLHLIAKTGECQIEWNQLMPIIGCLIHIEFYNYYQSYGFIGPLQHTFQGRYETVMELLKSFLNPPWTIQRLIELLLQPRLIYSTTHKFINGVEKLLSVTTTIES